MEDDYCEYEEEAEEPEESEEDDTPPWNEEEPEAGGEDMNFTDSPFEQMMKEVPRPGRGSSGPCAGCRYAKECKNQKGRCRKKFRALLVEPQASGQRGPKS